MDNNSYKILKYIGKHDSHKQYDLIITKYRTMRVPTVSDALYCLNTNHFIEIHYLDVSANGDLINPSTVVIKSKGKEYIEQHKAKRFSDKFARAMAIIAALISIASLIIYSKIGSLKR